MPRPVPLKNADVEKVRAIARAFREDGIACGTVTVGPDGWSLTWGQPASTGASEPYDRWKADRGEP